MGRSAESAAREKVRARSKKKLVGRRNESEQGCLTGHPAFGQLAPAFELEDMPEGGGYPVGFIEKVGALMGVTDYNQVLHICSGSVRAPLALDWRPAEGRLGCPDADVFTPLLRWEPRQIGADPRQTGALVECAHTPPHPRLGGSSCSVVGDARVLPFRDSCLDWIMADPPYDVDYAEALWRLGKRYPTPIVLLREAARVLRPGGMVAFLHHLVPILPEGLERVSIHGVSTGPGYRMRALTIAQKVDVGATLFDVGAQQRSVAVVETSLV